MLRRLAASDRIVRHVPGKFTNFRALLDSMVRGTTHSHSRIADLVFASFVEAKDVESKQILATEIFCKWMQTVEDFGALCLMCLAEETEDPLEKYLKVTTLQLVGFFGRCQGGLSYDEVKRLWGLTSTDKMIRLGLVAESQRSLIDRLIDVSIAQFQLEMKSIGRLFAEVESSTKKARHGDLLNMYFNAKHGVKLLLSTGVARATLDLRDDHLALVIGSAEVVDGERQPEKTLRLGTVSCEMPMVKKMVDDSRRLADRTADQARMRLGLLDDKLHVVKALSKNLPSNGTLSGRVKVGRNEVCPCGSKKKFKTCCGR